jgi:hypothetical protein
LTSQYHVHPVQIGQWRKTALEQMAELFVDGRSHKRANQDVEKDALYEQIGRLKVELDWLKKKSRAARLNNGVRSWIQAIPRSASGGSVNCWA